MDESNLDLEKLQNLQLLLPTQAEVKNLKAYTGSRDSLGQCEKFFFAMSAVSRLQSRIHVFIFRLQLPETSESLTRRMNVVRTACEQVTGCEKLVVVLQKVLAVGNVMNEGTYKGAASGFTLDSLIKITMTKGKDKKTTVLDAVARLLGEQGKSDLFDFPRELSRVEEAARIPKAQLLTDLSFLDSGLTRVKAERDALAAEGDGTGQDASLQKTEKFLDDASGVIAELRSTMAGVEEQCKQLADYFGEPATTPSEKVFDVMLEFTRKCMAAKDKYRRSRPKSEAL
jgi:hypothetical protein